jgi:hypothetical protein
MADMNRSDIILLARQIMGFTDGTKGGLDDNELATKVNHCLSRLCLLAEAPKTVFYLTTVFDDKYLPYDDQLLWIDQVTFIPPTGQAYDLDYVDRAVFPPSNGNPRSYWHTHVNVPDADGRSTPTLGLNPIPQISGANKNVRVTAYQKVKDLASSSDIPEFVSAVHPYVAYMLVDDWLPMHPRKLAEIGAHVKSRVAEAVMIVRNLAYGAKKKPSRSSDVQGYASMMVRRV